MDRIIAHRRRISKVEFSGVARPRCMRPADALACDAAVPRTAGGSRPGVANAGPLAAGVLNVDVGRWTRLSGLETPGGSQARPLSTAGVVQDRTRLAKRASGESETQRGTLRFRVQAPRPLWPALAVEQTTPPRADRSITGVRPAAKPSWSSSSRVNVASPIRRHLRGVGPEQDTIRLGKGHQAGTAGRRGQRRTSPEFLTRARRPCRPAPSPGPAGCGHERRCVGSSWVMSFSVDPAVRSGSSGVPIQRVPGTRKSRRRRRISHSRRARWRAGRDPHNGSGAVRRGLRGLASEPPAVLIRSLGEQSDDECHRALASPGGRHPRPPVTAASVIEATGAALAPVLDLLTRFWLAQAFLTGAASARHAPALTMSGTGGLAGALNAVLSSPFGFAVQTVCPVLLSFASSPA